MRTLNIMRHNNCRVGGGARACACMCVRAGACGSVCACVRPCIVYLRTCVRAVCARARACA